VSLNVYGHDVTTQTHARVQEALDWLRDHATDARRQEMGPKYGIHTQHAYGVSMASMKRLAKRLGTDHDLADALWSTELYEARIVASMVDEPPRVTSAQMDRWCGDFDNWAICDTVCFNLFDRAPCAWQKIEPWSRRPEEFVKRGSLALLWSLALHDKVAADELFVNGLELVERGALDDRPMVTKAASMALYAIGRRNAALWAAATTAAESLSASTSPSARTVGRSTLKRLSQA
jgi:3-methyladenine DNA glycosylase AlkD